jgi:hypothetical protein
MCDLHLPAPNMIQQMPVTPDEQVRRLCDAEKNLNKVLLVATPAERNANGGADGGVWLSL